MTHRSSRHDPTIDASDDSPDAARTADAARPVASHAAGSDRPTAEDVVSRVLSRAGTALASTAGGYPGRESDDDGALEREARAGIRRVAGLSTELEDVGEVEYRRIRLERVVLVGLDLSSPAASAASAPGAAPGDGSGGPVTAGSASSCRPPARRTRRRRRRR